MENKNKVDFKKNMKIYLTIAKPYKKLFLGASLAVLFVALAELVEKYIFKELIDQGTNYLNATITQDIFIQLLIVLAVFFVVAAVTKTLGNWFRFHFINTLESKMILDLKQRFFEHIMGLSHSFHTSHRTGSLIARFTRGGRAVESITDFYVFEVIPLGFRFLIAFIPILFIDLISALILVVMVLVFISYSMILLKRQQKLTVAMNQAEDFEKAHISDSFTNIETVKYFGKEEFVKDSFVNFSSETQKYQLRTWGFARWFASGHNIILFTSLIALSYSPIIRLINGDFTIGSIAFIYALYLNVVGPLERFTWHLRAYYTGMADFQTLTNYYDITNEVKDKPKAKNLKIKKGTVILKNISFKYKNKLVLENINLNIKQNEKVALVGHSGSGKTTIVKLLYRLYDLNQGKITIDGKNIDSVKQESLRQEMSIVPQEGILFNDSIENNIRFSKPNATKKEIIASLKKAQLYNFVKSLPDKEKTTVGERGIKLSGGEKQRLSIARAILANKKILVLDEATSALDSKTESEIQKALAKLMQGRTSIIIAHRLSTIMHADKIVVMDKGKIVQIGKHKELIRQTGPYKELWKLQKGGYIE
jgi:ATP-binding cassette, subfamily B, heavy metal transporter